MERLNQAGPTAHRGRISIVIPALNEAERIAAALDSVRGATKVEVIVVDGGSVDATRELARAQGAQVLSVAAGRAQQMNAGAAAATGEILLFLHADTRLPPQFDAYVHEALSQPGVVAGAFQLGIDASGRGLRVIEWLANFRTRRWQMPYGDQAIFLRAARFRETGGFAGLPIMEDFEFVRRLRRAGRIAIVPALVRTSARRWRELGLVKTTLINQAALVAYFLGVRPARIAAWYYGRGPKAPAGAYQNEKEKAVASDFRL